MSSSDQHLKISVLGDEWSYHHLAAISQYGPDQTYIYRNHFLDLMEDVELGFSDLCVIAVENSLAGDVQDNYLQIAGSGLFIVKEINLRIRLQMGALPGVDIEQIESVYTHPMGWKESSEFFSQYPRVQFIATPSTASGAKHIAEHQLKNAGAITSRTALQHYGLAVIREDIDNHPENITRFVVLSKKSSLSETTNKIRKASLLLQIPDNQTGSSNQPLSEEFRILFSRQLSDRELYIEAEIKNSSQFDHLQAMIRDKFWAGKIIGLFEVAGINEGI